jgi:hypothetical protein
MPWRCAHYVRFTPKSGFCATRHRSSAWRARRQGFERNARCQAYRCPTGAVGAAAAVTSDLPTDRRRRAGKALCDLPDRPTSGNATRNLFALLKPQRARTSPAWRWGDSSMQSQDPIDATLVPPRKRAGDIRHTLTALPALPELCPLLGRDPCPCIPLHRSPPNQARLEGVAPIG